MNNLPKDTKLVLKVAPIILGLYYGSKCFYKGNNNKCNT